jgi:hypothetical protein
VDKIAEYRNNAQECRTLAAKAADAAARESLLRMAETWDAIATTAALMPRVKPVEVADGKSAENN